MKIHFDAMSELSLARVPNGAVDPSFSRPTKDPAIPIGLSSNANPCKHGSFQGTASEHSHHFNLLEGLEALGGRGEALPSLP